MKRWINCLLVCLILVLMPITASAAENNGRCEYHTVHENCGYEVGIEKNNYLCDTCTEPTELEETADLEDNVPTKTEEKETEEDQKHPVNPVDDGTMSDAQPLSRSNVDQTYVYQEGAMPCIGNPNVLVFSVIFAGDPPELNSSLAGMEQTFFSEDGESLRTYYERSSYGKVHIDGTVYGYTTKYDVYHYTDALMILDEIIEHYQNIINWEDYDSNNDGYIDGIYIVPLTDVIWASPSFVANTPRRTVGNLSTSYFAFIRDRDLSTLCHETCHMFGMPDIYTGMAMNPHGSNTNNIMDEGDGDIPGLMKLALGWIDNPIFISGTGTTNLTLHSVSTNGEVAVIYPNGDPGNNNWMLIEYLTPEANNFFSGIRIWKTNVTLDDDNNVCGFQYLEAISPFGEKNYYFNAGEMVTPYSYPSTSYGVTYRSAGGPMTTNTSFDEIGFSGISIRVDDTNDECAELTVSIDNTIRDITGTATLTPHSSSDFLVDSTKLLIATVKSEQEMMVVGDISLKDSTTGAVIPVETVFNEYSNILYLYISEGNTKFLKANKTYQINLRDTVRTYYGSDIDIEGFADSIKIGNFGTAIHTAGPYESPYYGLDDFYVPDVFSIDSTQVMHFGYLNGALFMRTHNIKTQQYKDVEVALNPPHDMLQIDTVVQLDGKYYAVLFRNSLAERIITHIAVYESNGQLVDEFTPTNYVIYVGGHGHPMVVEDDHIESKVKELKVRNGKLILETTSFSAENGFAASQYKLTDTIYAYVDRVFTPPESTSVTLRKSSGEVLKILKYDGVRDLDLLCQEDKLYVLTAGEDLALYVYDSSFALIEKRVLMQQIKMAHLQELKLGINGNDVWLSFYSTSSINAVDYYNSYLIFFAPNLPPQYYRYGDASTTAVCNFAYVGHGTFFMGTQASYYLMQAEVDDHDYTYDFSVVAPTCTESGYTIYTCACGDSYVTDYTAPIPHKWSDGSCSKPRTCTVCGASSGKDGHIYDDGVDGICNTCGINRETVETRQVTHMFRMYNPNTGEHFYTGSEVERENLIVAGWQYEGVGFTFPANTGAPVHRLFQPSTGEHLYTMDEGEKATLMEQGWNYEGIAFNSAYDTEAVQHRLHNPNATVGAYHFTFSLEERDFLISVGWEYQNIGWYSCWK